MKIYKSINDYATILVDRDLNILDKNCDRAVRDSRLKYEYEITEDNVTCFFETILKLENIKPSFINPPCGSWSDFRVYPTDKFLYLNRNSQRPDIAYHLPEYFYFIGESKSSYIFFKEVEKFNVELKKINKLVRFIDEQIDTSLNYKTFVLFRGLEKEGNDLIEEIRRGEKEHVDYVVVIEEDNSRDDYNIRMIVLEV